MKIGILGSGDVGRTLGSGLAALGHEVMIGSREPDSSRLREWVGLTGGHGSTGIYAEAAAFAEVAILATRWSGCEAVIGLAGQNNLSAKVIIDVTNPLVFRPDEPPELLLGHHDSGGEQIQRWLPNSQVVKAFNTVGYQNMVNPQFPGGPPDMFIAGNDGHAKAVVAGFCTALGWNPVDLGGIRCSRMLEPLAALWVNYGMRSGSWRHAFKLLLK
jgi:predicted dinucleotide-binding enzyme